MRGNDQPSLLDSILSKNELGVDSVEYGAPIHSSHHCVLASQLCKLRGGDQKIDRSKIDQSGQSNALIWSCLQSLNKTSFLDSGGKASPYNHQVKEKI